MRVNKLTWISWNLRNWVSKRPTGVRMMRGALKPE